MIDVIESVFAVFVYAASILQAFLLLCSVLERYVLVSDQSSLVWIQNR